MIPPRFRQTVLTDEKLGLDAVLCQDEVELDGEVATVPERGRLATWLLDNLQSRGLYATKIAYVGKEGVPRRSPVLRPVEKEIYDHGYMRAHVVPVPALVRAWQGPEGVRLEFVDHAGNPTEPELPETLRAQVRDGARKWFSTLANRYKQAGLTLEESFFDVGVAEGRPYLIGTPGLPETSHLTDAEGDVYDYRLLEEGKLTTFRRRYEDVVRKLDAPVPVRRLALAV